MTVFDPQALKTTLLDAGVAIDDATMERVSTRLDRLWREHENRRLRFGPGLARTPQELINLDAALAEWLRSNSGECVFEQILVDRYGAGENLKSAYRLVGSGAHSRCDASAADPSPVEKTIAIKLPKILSSGQCIENIAKSGIPSAVEKDCNQDL
jgi:hypothetical protein